MIPISRTALLLISFFLFAAIPIPSAGAEQSNPDYPTSQSLTEAVFSHSQSHSTILSTYTIGTTHENRTIYAIKISDNPLINESDEPAVLFIGGHHGNELVSVQMTLHLIEYLTENYDTRADIRNLIDEREIWNILCVNPDGYERSISGESWRKNMRDNGDETFGVDLNRNYGYRRGTDAHTSSNPDSKFYHGPEAFSEPETQAVRSLVENISFEASISFHSYGELVLYPWEYTTEEQTDRHEERSSECRMSSKNSSRYDLQKEIASDMARMNGYTAMQASEQYVAHGDSEDWLYSQGVMSLTFELGTEHAPEDYMSVVEKNIAPCLYLIDIADDLSKAFLPEWTSMYYMAGDNSLSDEVSRDLGELKEVGSTTEMNLVALCDRDGDSDSAAYFIEKDNLHEIPLEDIDAAWSDELLMDRKSTLTSFLKWVVENYPARHYMLDIWGHGSSWRYAGFDGSKSNALTLDEISGAISETGVFIDIIAFDVCAMASVETATALKDDAGYLVASPKCGSMVDGQFRFCVQCGGSREG